MKGQHFSDFQISKNLRKRVMRNWINYKEPGGFWRPTNHSLSAGTPPSNWEGAYDFMYQSLAGPCQIFIGDSTDPINTALWGMRRADKPGAWVNFKLLSVNAVPPTLNVANNAVIWNEIQQNTDLVLQALPQGVRKYFRIRGNRPLTMRIAIRLPAGYSFEVVNSSYLRFLDDQGEERLRTQPLSGLSGTMAGPNEVDGTLIPVVVTEGNPVTVGSKSFPTIVIAPNPSVVSDILAAGGIAWVDPTTTISGASDIDDAILVSNAPGGNNGALTTMFVGCRTSSRLWRTVLRIPTSSIPDGTLTGFRIKLWQFSFSVTASSNTQIWQFFQVAAGNTWVEGTSTGGSESGACSWNQRITGTSDWAGGSGSGCGVSGTDYDADASPPGITMMTPYISGPDIAHTGTLPPSWATDWRDGGHANEGMVVIGTDESGTVNDLPAAYTSDSGTNPLYFEIDYSSASASFFFIGF